MLLKSCCQHSLYPASSAREVWSPGTQLWHLSRGVFLQQMFSFLSSSLVLLISELCHILYPLQVDVPQF